MNLKPEIIANETSKECRELLKEIVRQYGQIIELLTTTITYIPPDAYIPEDKDDQ